MENKTLIDKLNINLADVQVLYVKLHNYHWNIQGHFFHGIHTMTEGYYEHLAEQYDEIAERILQINGKPLTTMKSYLEKTGIEEVEKDNFNADDVLNGVINDFEYLKNEFIETSKYAEELRDLPTQALADENIAWLEKALWMLRSSK